MKITVVITTWSVPFPSVVRTIVTFDGAEAEKEALIFVNTTALLWFQEQDGMRSEVDADWPYQPITELGYDPMRFQLWGGEQGFEAILDEASFKLLHDAHYKREFDNKGLARPGYLINAYVAEGGPEAEKYKQQQAEGIAAVEAGYGDKTRN